MSTTFGTPGSPTATPVIPGFGNKQITLPYVPKNVNDLLLWRDPKKSGAVFGAATLVYFLFDWSGFSFIAILAYAALAGVVVSLVWSQAGGFISKQGPPVPAILKEGISDEQWKKLSDTARVQVNKALSVAGVILSGKDPKVSLQVAGALYGVAQASSRISIFGTAYTLVVLAFALPRTYELKKDQIDEKLQVLTSKGKELYAKFDEAVLRKIPQAKKTT